MFYINAKSEDLLQKKSCKTKNTTIFVAPIINRRKSSINLETMAYVISEDCVACGTCIDECPVGAISGALKQVHTIDAEKCIKCGACLDSCPKKAIYK